MRKLILTLALLCAAAAAAQTTTTPNVGLQLPAYGSTNWNIPLQFNFNRIDSIFGGNTLIPGLKVTNLTVTNLIFPGGAGFLTPGSYGQPNGTAQLNSSSLLSNLFLTPCGPSGTGHSAGIVPDPGPSAGTTRVLYENCTWGAIAAAITAAQIQQQSLIYAADTGAANVYAVSQSPSPTVGAGSVVVFKALHANTGASTLAVNGGSAIAIKKPSPSGLVALVANDIIVGQLVTAINDGTQWQAYVGASGSVTAAAITAAIQGNTNCNIDATYYWNPSTGNCTQPSGGGGGSAHVKYVSACSGTPIDPTIGLTAAGGAGTDYATCINGFITAAAGAPLKIVLDQSVLTSNIHIPPAGNVSIEGLGAGIANTPVTNCAVTGFGGTNVATLTAKNNFKVGQNILLNGLTLCAFLNVPNAESAPYFTVLSAGLSSTQFEVAVTHANISSGAETGYGSFMYGTWLFAAPGANNDVISVSATGTLRSSGPNTAPIGRGANMVLRGFAINGNRGNGTDGNSTTGDARGSGTSWYSNIHIWDMEDVLIDNVELYNSPAFALSSDNSGHVKIINSRVDSFLKGQTPASTNQDGFHFNGYSNDLYLSNDYFRTGDDAVALNSPEGYCGPITKVVANNLTFDNVQQFGRAYTRSAACGSGVNPTISYVAFDSWVGNALNQAWEWGFDTVGGLTSSIDHVTWSNSRLSAPKGFLHIDTIGELTIDNVKLVDLTSGGFWNGVRFGATATVTTLNLTNDAIVRTAAGNAGVGAVNQGIGVSSSLTAANLNIRNFRIEDEGGSYGATGWLVGGSGGGTITNLVYDYDPTNISAVSSGITVTNIKTLTLSGCVGCTTAANMKAALAGLTGCTVSGNVWSVQDATCITAPNPTASGMQAAINPLTGCSTAGFVWVPQSNTCINPATGAPFQPSALPLPPAFASWTWVNQGSDTESNNGNFLAITHPNTGSTYSIGGLKIATPATPFSVAFYWRSSQQFSNSQASGVFLTDGTKLIDAQVLTQNSGALTFRVEHESSPTTDTSTPFIGQNAQSMSVNGGMYLRFRDDGTTIYLDTSADGANWHNVYTEAVGSFLTPTGYGFGALSISTGGSFVQTSLQGLLVTNSAAL